MPVLLVEKGYLLPGNASGVELSSGYVLIEDGLITCVSKGSPTEVEREKEACTFVEAQLVVVADEMPPDHGML